MSSVNPRVEIIINRDEDKRQEIWTKAVKLFHEKKYLESLLEIVPYFDEETEVRFENGKHKFELRQGSVILYCRITEDTFYAYINVLKVEYPDPIVFRRLLNLNISAFNQTKASIVKNYIRLTTETMLDLASPSKIFWDLHELATEGDKLDDVLSIYSKGVKEIDIKRDYWDENKKKKGAFYIKKWIDEALEKSQFWYEKNDLYAASWWLIGRIFSILYFVHPEGKLYEEFQTIVDEYNNQDRSQDENIKRVILKLRKIRSLADDELYENFFSAKLTFLTAKPMSSDLLVKYLESSLNSANRFKSLGYIDSEYISLLYGLGLILNNFMLDSEYVREMARIYEMGHLDFMNDCYPSEVKKHFSKDEGSKFAKIKKLFQKSSKPEKMNLAVEKDRAIIIKKIRSFYEKTLSGDI
jgi:hypothetical protein